MTKKELIDYLADFRDDAKIVVVVNNAEARYSMAYGCDDGGSKATAHDVCIVAGGSNEAAQHGP